MVTSRHGAIPDPESEPEIARVLIDPPPVPNHHTVKSLADITNQFQKSIELLSQKKVYPSNLSTKLMDNVRISIDEKIIKTFGEQQS